jgi:hypothetical protein
MESLRTQASSLWLMRVCSRSSKTQNPKANQARSLTLQITKSKSKSGKVTDLTNLKEGQTINMMQMAVVVGANIE